MSRKRLLSLDLMRGVAILWMLMLHFGAFYNYWAPRRIGLSQPIPFEGNFCFAWSPVYVLGEQIFLLLAAASLGLDPRPFDRERTARLLKRLAVLFAFITLLQFVAFGEDISHALTFSPIHAWCVILATIGVIAHLGGTQAVAAAAALGGLAMVVLAPLGYGDAWERSLTAALGVPWEYNARPEFFFGTGCVGYLLARLHAFEPARALRQKLDLAVLTSGLALCLPWIARGTYVPAQRSALFANEYIFAHSGMGLSFIWGLSTLVLWALLRAEDARVFEKARGVFEPLRWIGVHSLLIFAVHEVTQSRIVFPLHSYLAWRFGFPVRATDWVVFITIAVTFALVAGLQVIIANLRLVPETEKVRT